MCLWFHASLTFLVFIKRSTGAKWAPKPPSMKLEPPKLTSFGGAWGVSGSYPGTLFFSVPGYRFSGAPGAPKWTQVTAKWARLLSFCELFLGSGGVLFDH